MLSILGELLFTIAIGYMGAVELLFVLKHLYHWSFQHHRRLLMLHERGDDESLKELQEHIQKSIDEAGKEEIPGFQRMKDGIFYKDGFRIDPNIANKIKSENKNQPIKREIIGSCENKPDQKENEISEKLNENIIVDKENNKLIEDTRKIQDEEDNLKDIKKVVVSNENKEDIKKVVVSNENMPSQNDEMKIEVQEEIIIKEQVPLITSSIPPPKQTDQSYSVEFDEPEIEIPEQDDKNERINLTQTVKTQIGQTNIEQYSLRSPSKLKIGKSDDSSSIEPWSSQKSSSLSTQQSSSIDTAMSVPDMHFDEYERQAPDGEDVPTEQHYSDEYLRSLDGIKNRPLIRDDGSGRRRAFKKRRSSGDSTSSRESRQSREEELKMFTSLEEEELATIKKNPDGNGGEFTPIRYSSDPNLKVNKSHRRRKRSPAQDSPSLEKLGSNSLEMLGEEDTNPWGDVKPEHYKDTEFWKREKSNSIPEELEETGINERDLDLGKATTEHTENMNTLPKKNIPKMSSFEEASHSQHEKAISIIKNQGSKDAVESISDDKKVRNEKKSDDTKNVSSDEIYAQESQTLADKIAFASAFDKQNTSQETDEVACNQPYDHSESHSTGSGLRRSPRMDEIDHYEERWEQEERRKSSSLTPSDQQWDESGSSPKRSNLSLDIKSKSIERSITPEKIEVKITYEPVIEYKDAITVEKPSKPTIEIDYASDDDSDGKEVNLGIEEDDYDDDIEPDMPTDIMAGLSDFYDFNASINPTRSRVNSFRRSKSAEPLTISPTVSRSKSPNIQKMEEPDKCVTRSPSPSTSDPSPKIQNISFLSDFYDFNVKVNQQAYNRPVNKSDQGTPRDSIDLLIADLDKLQSQYKLENLDNLKEDTEIILQIDRLKNDIVELRDVSIRTQSPNSLSPMTPETPEYPINITQIIPRTPDYPRSFSTELKDVERLKAEIITGEFKRSTYVGESADFSDDFEELREQTRHFCRSQSQSRSPNGIDNFSINANRNTAKKELQDRILEEITKTTVNFQDFSRDLTKDFLEHERRVSDSAIIIQKPEILIQLEDDLDDLEPEEYHHFRRFSIKQEHQTEEYPIDDIIYVDQIEVTTEDGATETWQRDDIYTSEDKGVFSQMEDCYTSDNISDCNEMEDVALRDSYTSNQMDEVVLSDTYTSQDINDCEQLKEDTYISEHKYHLEDDILDNYNNLVKDVSDNYCNSNDKSDISQINEIITDNTDLCEIKEVSSLVDGNILEETYTNEDKEIDEIVAQIAEMDEEYQNNLLDELNETDSNSSDGRQTIVEVDDGIDVDVLDYNERTEESYNEQSECEEYDRTIDRYANTTASDWKVEGAVGGVIDEEFDQLYGEAIKDRKQSGIQRDYDGIVENITDEKNMEFNDTISIRTEDLLEEILQADEERYGCSRSRDGSKESNRSLLDGSEHRYLADAVSQSISSTRLRSRYGLLPATGSYANFENYEDVDIHYKPKKEYNWRKNFKIDEENNEDENNDKIKYKESEYSHNIDVYDDTLLNSRKYSLGGESITLFSRSRGNSEYNDELVNVPEENLNDFSNDGSFFREEHKENIEEENIKNTETTEVQLEDIEKIHKRKKSKKKLRKGSKGSLGNDDENSQSRRESLIDSEITDNLEEAPKKKKKKKRVKESLSIEEEYKSEISVPEKLSSVTEDIKSEIMVTGKFSSAEDDIKLKVSHTEEASETIKDNSESKSIDQPNQLPIEKSPFIANSPSETPELNKSSQKSIKKEAETISVESLTPTSIESIDSAPSFSHSVSTSSDISTKSQKLDKIESSDIIDLIKDSSILGSSF